MLWLFCVNKSAPVELSGHYIIVEWGIKEFKITNGGINSEMQVTNV
jgi:hypothetical protein